MRPLRFPHLGSRLARPLALTLGLLLIFFGGFSTASWSATISYSGEEVHYRYQFKFRSMLGASDLLDRGSAKRLAEEHAAHLFGLFHTADYAEKFGYPKALVEGFAGTRKVKITAARTGREKSNGSVWVDYTAESRMLVLNRVLDTWTQGSRSAKITLPLLVDLPKIYANSLFTEFADRRWSKCGDDHYSSALDFSYFYNPYKCPELAYEPLAEAAEFQIQRIEQDPIHFSFDQDSLPLTELHSDNANDELILFYFVNGFDEEMQSGSSDRNIHRDYGWKNYQALDRMLKKRFGFQQMDSLEEFRDSLGPSFFKANFPNPIDMQNDFQRRYYSTYVRRFANGKIAVVRSALFNARNEATARATKSFPSFWREAWENGDLIYFSGHSGDGQSLNLKTMLNTLSAHDRASIRVPFGKKQAVFLDACSSYDHFSDEYRKLNPAGLYLMTYGLVSLFHLAPVTMESLLALFLPGTQNAPTWKEALGFIEASQLRPHVEFSFDRSDWERAEQDFRAQNFYPSFLLNVQTPDN